MKVVHVCEYVKGGVKTYLDEVINYQKAHNIDVYIICSRYNSDYQFDIPDDHIKTYNYKRKLSYFIKAIYHINKKVNEIDPDIIHIHSTFAGVFTRIPFFIQHPRAKIVYCSHGWSFLMEGNNFKKSIFRFIENRLSKRTDLIINISKYELENSIRNHLPEKKSILIYNGIRVNDQITNSNFEFKVRQSDINLLFVGRFDKSKGLDLLLNFMRDSDRKDVKLYTIGEAVLNDKVVNIPDNVENIGWVNYSEIDSYYQLFDAVIIPSRWEGFGLVAIEAMKNKKAVIASNRGALPELVRDQFNGYLFDLNNFDTLREIIKGLNKKDLSMLGINGYRYFKDNFTSDIMNRKILEGYYRLNGPE